MPYIIDEDTREQQILLAKEQDAVRARESLVSVREALVLERENKSGDRDKECARLIDESVALNIKCDKELSQVKEEREALEKDRQSLLEFKSYLENWQKTVIGEFQELNNDLCQLRRERLENDKIVRDICDKQAELNDKGEQIKYLVKENIDSAERLDRKIAEFKEAEQEINNRIIFVEKEEAKVAERSRGLDAKERNLNDFKRILDIREGELIARELSK